MDEFYSSDLTKQEQKYEPSDTQSINTPLFNNQITSSRLSAYTDYDNQGTHYDSDGSTSRKASSRIASPSIRKSPHRIIDPERSSVLSAPGIIEQNLKIEELKNHIRDLERKLKDCEHDNKALKRIQARHEKELLKMESTRGDVPDLIKSHSEELKSLRNLLKQNKEKQREHEKKLKLKDSECQKLRQELSQLRGFAKDKDLLSKNDFVRKIEVLELELNSKNSELMKTKKQLEILERVHNQDLTAEKSYHKQTQKQLAQLQADYEQLVLYTKNPINQTGNLRRNAAKEKSPLHVPSTPDHSKRSKNAGNSLLMDISSGTSDVKHIPYPSLHNSAVNPGIAKEERKFGPLSDMSMNKSFSETQKNIIPSRYLSTQIQNEPVPKDTSRIEDISPIREVSPVKSVPWLQQNRPKTLDIKPEYGEVKRNAFQSIDSGKKEKLLAKLKEIDQSKEDIDPVQVSRGRLTSENIFNLGTSRRSPVRRATQGRGLASEFSNLSSSYSPSFVTDTGMIKQKMPEAVGRKAIFRDADHGLYSKLSKSDMDIFGQNNIRPERTLGRHLEAETLIFPEARISSNKVFPWEQKAKQ